MPKRRPAANVTIHSGLIASSRATEDVLLAGVEESECRLEILWMLMMLASESLNVAVEREKTVEDIAAPDKR